jgi:two-component system, OmpR family, sensor kinase
MLSLRLKLTLYYLGILSVVLILCGLAIYFYLSRSLIATIDESLDRQLQKFERMVKQSTHDALMADPDTLHDDEPESEILLIPPQMLQVINSRGVIKFESYAHAQDKMDVELAALQQLEYDKTIHDTVRMPSGELLRVTVRRTKGHDGEDFYVRLGQSLAALERARKKLLLVLSIALPIALLLSSYGGLVLANQALRPVDRITRAAEEIAAGALTKRVPAPAKMDELGRLAATFNYMISRLQAAFERQKQFTSDASHELRTPLAVLRGDIEIALRRERTAEEYQQTLTSNLEEIVRLSRLVEDLLMLARADSGRVELWASSAPA